VIYPPDAFIALVQEVERQGGALLDDPCEKHDVVYKAPPYASPSVQEKITCGCGHQARLVTIYDKDDVAAGVGGAGFATACAVCDNIGIWPRYCDAVYEVDPELNPAFYDEDEEEDAD
jgi:hypothetical protein